MPEFDDRDVLLKAAGIVEQGWCQNIIHERSSDGSAIVASCAMGAIVRAAEELNPLEMSRAIWTLIGYLHEDIAYWNDAHGRTAHEVAETMRRAADV